ncbi:MAG: putative ABC exporter domain-containing protein [bacterium]
MNPGLLYLLRLGPRRKLRHLARRTRGRRRRVLSVLSGIALLAILSPQVLQFVSPWRLEAARALEPGYRLWGPLVLALLALLGVAVGYGLHFRASEIDFLFPAPIPRRQLVLYNIVARLGVGVLSALWLTLFMAHHAPNPWAGVVGVYLAIVFLQWVAKLSVLAFSALSVKVRTRSPYLAPIFLLLLLLAINVFSGSRVAGGRSVRETVEALSHTPLARALTAPTRPFVEVFLAQDLATFARAFVGAVAILAAMLAAMLGLDVSFEEGAVRVQQEMETRAARMRSGGGVYTSAAPIATRLRLPAPPRLGGVGPIAWRQATEAMRNARGLATAMGVMVLTALLPVLLVRGDATLADTSAGKITLGVILFATLSVTQQFPFDFRRDLDRMSLLKTLPLHPSAIALGQLVPTVVLFSAAHLAVLGVVIVTSGLVSRAWWAAAALAIVPFNGIHIALDNALFLLMPQRFELKDTGGFRMLDRMGIMLIKMPTLLVAGGVGGGLGLLVYRYVWSSVIGAGLGAGVGFALVAMPIVWWVGRLFARFDVPRDTPE